VAYRDLAAVTDQGRAQQSGLGQGTVEEALRRVSGNAQPQGLEARSLAIDEGARPDALGEAP
jgi:hypothetical protein